MPSLMAFESTSLETAWWKAFAFVVKNFANIAHYSQVMKTSFPMT